ncbi:hypothetical protein MA16_Dca025648 [Dendrobium catenatum]|uniref:Uncharacterized protein n=1 Tax=Dendrobium catenatum TaxID=906689 RepID=A0A2I0VC85_9ASPA|nr:hypothetical protein MA16_Dca025648 [Dendrobium catenatum]
MNLTLQLNRSRFSTWTLPVQVTRLTRLDLRNYTRTGGLGYVRSSEGREASLIPTSAFIYVGAKPRSVTPYQFSIGTGVHLAPTMESSTYHISGAIFHSTKPSDSTGEPRFFITLFIVSYSVATIFSFPIACALQMELYILSP